jgi:hypothetical protein
MFLLGIADLISASLLVRGFYNLPIPETLIYVFAGYLIIKGVIFIVDIGSIMDIGGGILLILSLHLSLPLPIYIFFAILIAFKGTLTVFGAAKY